VNGDVITLPRRERALLLQAGEDVHLVSQAGEGASLIPGIGTDAAEAGLRRVLEGK
jgi:hypothetical protein